MNIPKETIKRIELKNYRKLSNLRTELLNEIADKELSF